jgi:hypothetical protein
LLRLYLLKSGKGLVVLLKSKEVRMMKSGLILLLILFIAIPLLAAKKDWKAVETKVYPSLDMNDAEIQSVPYPNYPVITLSPGMKVGDTWYDYQHNGTISKQIALDPTGCIHFFWMNGLDFQAVNRHVYYNYGDPTNDSIGVQIDPGIVRRSGYITGDMLSDGRAVAVYHASLTSWPPTGIASAAAIDLSSCLGSFNQVFPDTISLGYGSSSPIWPHVAVDDSNWIHVFAHPQALAAGDPSPVYYSRSTDLGNTFSPWTLVEDSLYTISYDVQTSRNSGNVAVAYCHAVPWDPSQIQEDIYYVESTDYGTTWDFANPINVTNFVPADTFRAYADVSTVYDNAGNLHLAFSLRQVEGDTLFFFASVIAHWSNATGMTIINADSMIGLHSGYSSGAFRMMADRPSLGVDPTTGYLYCVFVGNTPGDTSAAGWPNAELYATCSQDGGLTWGPAINLTNTPSPGCTPGNCEDDDYPSLAEIVDDSLHILYVNDKDAGGAMQMEGTWTLNPVLYLKVPVSLIPWRIPIHDGGVVGLQAPDSACVDSTVNLCVNIENFGNTPETFNVISTIGSFVDTSQVVNLVPGEPISVCFDWQVPSIPDTFQFVACTEIPGDTITANDCDTTPIRTVICQQVGEEEEDLKRTRPKSYALFQSHPNPLRNRTEIRYQLPEKVIVSLKVYDIMGNVIQTLVDGVEDVGIKRVIWDGQDEKRSRVGSGIYFYRLETRIGQATHFTRTKKMIILR